MLIDYRGAAINGNADHRAMGRSAALRPIEGGGADIPVTALMSNYGARERERRADRSSMTGAH